MRSLLVILAVLSCPRVYATTLSPQSRLEVRARCYVWNPTACTDKTKKADAEIRKSIGAKEKLPAAAKRITQFAWLVLKQRKAPVLALKRFNQAAILDPSASDPWWGAGEAYLALEMDEEAERVLLAAAKLNLKATGPVLSLASLKERQGKLGEAETLATDALDRDPKSRESALSLARILALERKVEDAKRVYKRALALGAKPNAELEKKLE